MNASLARGSSWRVPQPSLRQSPRPRASGSLPLSELQTDPRGLALEAPRPATVATELAGARDAATLAAPRVHPKPRATERPRREARKGSAAGPAPCAGLLEEEEEGEEVEACEGGRARPPGGRRERGGGGRPAGRGGGTANERRAVRGGEGWGMR